MPGRSNQEPLKRASIPLWLGFIAAISVWNVLPWAISLLTPHHGWIAGHLSPWNWLGLILVAVGNLGLCWGLLLHSRQTPRRLDMEMAKTYLLRDSAYRFSRNPLYLSELTLLLGWVIFYGSLALLIAFLVWWVIFNYFQIPLEERVLEASFGDSYRDYRSRVPRWFGKP